MVGGLGDITPIDEGLLKGLKAWNSQFDKINDTAAEIRDKMLAWLGLKPDGTVLDETRWGHVLTAVEGIGVAIAAWTVSSGALKFLSALGVLEKTQAMTMAFGLTLGLTGIWFMYNGIKKLVDGQGDLLTWVEALGGAFTGALGLASVIKAAKFGAKLSWGNSLAIGFGITALITGVMFITDAIRNKDWKAAAEGIISSAIGILTIIPSVKIGLSKIGLDGAATGLKGIGKHAATASTSMGTFAGTVAKATVGVAGLAVSLQGGYNNMKNYAQGTETFGQAMLGLAGSTAGAVASGAMLGSVFGPLGTAIGAVGGGLVAIGSNLVGFNKGMDEASSKMEHTQLTAEQLAIVLEKSNAALAEGNKAYEENFLPVKQYVDNQKQMYTNTIANLGLAEAWKEKLLSLVDSNGKVTGSETEVKVALEQLNSILGTNFELQNGHITLNGKVFKSYDELNGKIEEYVKQLKMKAQQEVITDRWKKAYEFNQEYARTFDRLKESTEAALNEYHKMEAEHGANSEAAQKAWENYMKLSNELTDLEVTHKEYSDAIETFNDDIAKTYQDGTEIIIDSETGKMSVLTTSEQQIRDTMQMTSDQMIELARTSTDEWNAKYDQLDTEQKARMLRMSTTIDNLSPDFIAKWSDLAKNSQIEFGKEIDRADDETRGAILAAVTATNDLTPSLKNEWQQLADKSQAEFGKALAQVDATTRKEILKSISTTQANIEKHRVAWYDFSQQSPKEYEAALSELDPATAETIKTVVGTLENDTTVKEASKGLGTDVIGGYDETANNPTAWLGINNKTFGYMAKWINNLDMSTNARTKGETNIANLSAGINNRLGWVQSSINQVRSTMSGVTDGTNPWNKGANFLQGIIDGINNKFPKLTSLVSTVAGKVSKIFSGKWVEHSPSRLARQQGAFYMEGLALGFEAEENGLYKTAGMIADGVTVTMQDTLSGQTLGMTNALQDSIQVNSTATISGTVQNNMKELIAEAVTDANVNVNIEAKTEEGVIVRKATDGINSYIRQTGEMPFPVLI